MKQGVLNVHLIFYCDQNKNRHAVRRFNSFFPFVPLFNFYCFFYFKCRIFWVEMGIPFTLTSTSYNEKNCFLHAFWLVQDAMEIHVNFSLQVGNYKGLQ